MTESSFLVLGVWRECGTRVEYEKMDGSMIGT